MKQMILRKTYSHPGIHGDWRETYRQDSAQLAFDNEIYDWLFRVLKPDGAWLDAGCGSGERTLQLARRCQAVFAVDISPVIQETAKARIAREQLADKVEFICSPLEELAGVEARNVHCRGVLMHIPDWRTSLDNLCRVVRPGGYLVLFEGNGCSIEALIVRIARRFQKRKSKLSATEGGLEFWSETDGNPFLVRMAYLERITHEVASRGFEVVLQRSMQLLDVNRFPAAWRRLVIRLNRLWFRFGLPFGSGVIIVARRT
jgi:SAM-dependent methyltransferase